MKHSGLLLISLLSYTITQSQTPFAELPTPKIPRNLQSFAVGDTLFIFYDIPKTELKTCFQINPDGSSQRLYLSKLKEQTLIVGVSRHGDDNYFYYVSGKKKSLALKAFVYNGVSKQDKTTEEELPIKDEIWGISNNTETQKLELVLYESDSNRLTISRVDRLKIASEKNFIIPVTLPNDYLEYIPESRNTPLAQGVSKAKIIKAGNKIYLTIDKSYFNSGGEDPHTVFVKFDIEKDTATVQKILSTSKDNFRSFAYNDILYRSTASKKAISLDKFDKTSGNFVTGTTIVKDTALKRSFIYRRVGKAQAIHKRETLYGMINRNFEPSIVVPWQSDSCGSAVIWGTYFQGEGGVVVPLSLNLPTVVGAVIATAASQMIEYAGVSRYCYMNSPCNGEFTRLTSDIKPLRQVIDDYEIALAKSGVTCEYKRYVDLKNGCIGLYVDDHHQKLILTRFDDL